MRSGYCNLEVYSIPFQTHSVTGDSTDDRLPHGSDADPASKEVTLVRIGKILVFHFLDVSTGCKQDNIVEFVQSALGQQGQGIEVLFQKTKETPFPN